jgi:hypothetical protein
VRDEANEHRRMAKDELAALPPPEANGGTDSPGAGLKRKSAPRAAAAGPAGS